MGLRGQVSGLRGPGGTDGRMDGRTDRQMDRPTKKWMDKASESATKDRSEIKEMKTTKEAYLF